MTIKWTLRVAMAERGLFSMAEFGRLLEDKVGYPLTPPALHRLGGGRAGEPPKEIKLATLDALLQALDMPATDFGIFRYEPPTAENQAAQPLVVNADVRPARRAPGQGDRPRRDTRPRKAAPATVRRTPPPDTRDREPGGAQ